MGQYYKAISLKQNWKIAKNPISQYAHPHDYDNGLKLMEHAYIGNKFMRVVEEMLNNEMMAKPFVWCGDYSDGIKTKFVKDENLYDIASDMKPLNKGILCDNFEECEFTYLINDTKREFVNLAKLYKKSRETDEWIIHPLALLCCDGNGRGGGDYNGINMDEVGRWKYDRIYTYNEVPNGFKEIEIEFKEEY